jgi:hypothetical protein
VLNLGRIAYVGFNNISGVSAGDVGAGIVNGERRHTKFLVYFSRLGNHMPISYAKFCPYTWASFNIPLSPKCAAAVLCVVSFMQLY